jgi:hypothetical protein
MGGYATGGEGFWSNPLGSVKSLAEEAWSGNLSDIDKQTILDNGAQAIATASAGADPGTIAANQSALLSDVNAALDSFSVAGDSGGAQPSNDLRLPGGMTLSPATLEWMAIGVAVLIIGVITLPYIAPSLAGSITAGRSLHRAATE